MDQMLSFGIMMFTVSMQAWIHGPAWPDQSLDYNLNDSSESCEKVVLDNIVISSLKMDFLLFYRIISEVKFGQLKE